MEIKYKFVNGEETSIEVYGDFEGIILELDRDLKNNNRKETRRHESLALCCDCKVEPERTGFY